MLARRHSLKVSDNFLNKPLFQRYHYFYGFPWVYRLTIVGVPLALAGLAEAPGKRIYFIIWAGLHLVMAALLFFHHQRELQLSGFAFKQVKVLPDYLLHLRLPSELAGYSMIRFGERAAIANKEINSLLNAKPLAYELTNSRYRLPAFLRKVAPVVMREANRSGKELFNDPKLRLNQDLSTANFTGKAVEIEKTDYFSTLLSNDLTSFSLRKGSSKESVLEGSSVVANDGIIYPLAESPCSNHIGISIMAFSSDGHLIMTTASARQAQNSGLVTPSATGAIAPEDFAHTGPQGVSSGLQWPLQAAAERELRKEFSLAPEVPIQVRLTGYARFLNRGGKPEFYAVATIGQELLAFQVGASESTLIDSIKTLGAKEYADTIPELQRMIDVFLCF